MVKRTLSYTITEKGTVTIPAEVRKKYKLRKGSRVKFVETGEGILLVPVIPLEELFGVDKNLRIVYQMIKELQEERRREASEEG